MRGHCVCAERILIACAERIAVRHRVASCSPDRFFSLTILSVASIQPLKTASEAGGQPEAAARGEASPGIAREANLVEDGDGLRADFFLALSF